jgi:hypothetical protein
MHRILELRRNSGILYTAREIHRADRMVVDLNHGAVRHRIAQTATSPMLTCDIHFFSEKIDQAVVYVIYP